MCLHDVSNVDERFGGNVSKTSSPLPSSRTFTLSVDSVSQTVFPDSCKQIQILFDLCKDLDASRIGSDFPSHLLICSTSCSLPVQIPGLVSMSQHN